MARLFLLLAQKAGLDCFRWLSWQPNPTQPDRTLFDSWTAGRTGNAFVDANMREMEATGFMSNRGRQNVASYLIHDLHQD